MNHRLEKISINRSPLLLFFFVAVVSFATRLPFLNAGYGNDPDSWRVADTAQKIASTGQYSASRPPGYPVHELVSAVFWQGGPVVLNILTAVLASFAVGFFALSAYQIGVRPVILASIAFALVPVVYIASTTTIDYMWALSFIMGALYFAIVRRPVVSGILLGAAIGCRITSALMIIPLGVLFARGVLHGDHKRFRDLLVFIGMSTLMGVVFFAPPLITYGMDVISFYEFNGTILSAVKGATFGVWGRIGLIGVFAAILYILFKARKTRSNLASLVKSEPILVTTLLVVIIYGAAYARLPSESGYLIPIVPFLILSLAKLLPRMAFIVLAAFLVLSPMLSIGPKGITPGPILIDHESRLVWMRFAEVVSGLQESLPPKNIVVAGDWTPKLQARSPSNEQQEDVVITVFSLSEQEAQDYIDLGYQIRYLPGQIEFAGAVYAEGQVFPLVTDSIDDAFELTRSIIDSD